MDATARRTLRAVTRKLRRLLEGTDYFSGPAIGEFAPGVAAFCWAFRLLLLRSLQVRKLTSADLFDFARLEDMQLWDGVARACAAEQAWFPELLATPLPKPRWDVLRRCINLIWGHEMARGQRPATAAMLTPPAALSWAYQFWKAEDKKDVLERMRTRKSLKVEGDDVISATSLYTEAYMARFLLQKGLNDLHRKSALKVITVFDPACGAGHLLLEAFESLHGMYLAEKRIEDAADICAEIFDYILYGFDVDVRGVLLARVVLALRAAEKAPGFRTQPTDNVAALVQRLPARIDHLSAFLGRHPDLEPFRTQLADVFRHLQHADELGALLRIRGLLKRGPQSNPAALQIASMFVVKYFTDVGTPRESSLPFTQFSSRLSFGALTLLGGEYNVVLTNPPYLGPKHMGQVLRRHLAECYPDTREDLQTAFLQRCFELTRDGGVTATVTVKSWLYQASFRKFRREVLSNYTLSAFADLGSNAFHADQGLHHGVNVILTCFWKRPPAATHEVHGVRLVSGKGPEAKEKLLQAALDKGGASNRFTFPQSRLLELPDAPFCYELPASILDALKNGPTLAGRVKQGLATTDNNRFLRFAWEVPTPDLHQRWFPCAKGGTHCKWVGLNYVRVNWQCDGAAIKAAIVEKYPYLSGWQWVAKNAEYYFKPGLTYSYMCYGSLSARLLENALFEVASIGVFPEPEQRHLVLAVLNSRTASWILRALCQKHMFQAGITEKLPLPTLAAEDQEKVKKLVEDCLRFKQRLLGWDLCEMNPEPFLSGFPRDGVREYLRESRDNYLLNSLRLFGSESRLEKLLGWPLTREDARRRDEELGPPEKKRRPPERDLLADYLTVKVLALFGHSWAGQQENAPGPGVLPLVAGCGSPTVHELLRKSLARDFTCGVEKAENEIATLLGLPLSEWLSTQFFRHQVRRWKRRPPLWQVQSKPGRRRQVPAFACLIYYHRLNSDTLREGLAAPLRAGLQGDARAELDQFLNALERVEKEGFYSPELWTRANEEPLDAWCSAERKSAFPRTRDALLRQESRYVPDLHDGVRVNVAPLQREGLLAVNVLAKRDVERALADRAVWRAEERRLCRAGKLPRPGWWANLP